MRGSYYQKVSDVTGILSILKTFSMGMTGSEFDRCILSRAKSNPLNVGNVSWTSLLLIQHPLGGLDNAVRQIL